MTDTWTTSSWEWYSWVCWWYCSSWGRSRRWRGRGELWWQTRRRLTTTSRVSRWRLTLPGRDGLQHQQKIIINSNRIYPIGYSSNFIILWAYWHHQYLLFIPETKIIYLTSGDDGILQTIGSRKFYSVIEWVTGNLTMFIYVCQLLLTVLSSLVLTIDFISSP